MGCAGIEVLDKPALLKVDGVEDGERVVVLSFASVVGYEAFPNDGATIVLDDLVGDLAEFSGKSFKVNFSALHCFSSSPCPRVWLCHRVCV